MPTAGWISETLNMLYVDKNLKHHGLIQAYSRTNRLCKELKNQGNIVCFFESEKECGLGHCTFCEQETLA